MRIRPLMSFEITITRFSRKAQRRVWTAWLAAIALGLFGLHQVLEQEKTRDLQQWETRLNLTASAHGNALAHWVDGRQIALRNLAANVSLKLYLTELSRQMADPSTDAEGEPAELTFLRNLLIASAESGGFASPPQEVQKIRANMPLAPGAGVLITTAAFTPIVSTHAIPSLEQLPQELRATERPAAPVMSPAFELTPGTPALAFRLPVFGVQQSEDSPPLGYIIAVTLLDKNFYSLLGSIVEEPSAESLVLTPENGGWRFISPLQDGKKSFALAVDGSSTLVSITAARTPGTLARGIDYRGQSSLAVAQPVRATPWLVTRKIDESVALRETNARALFLYVGYVLCAALITAGVVALWRHASALRAKQVAYHYKNLSSRIQKQEALLELIAETTPIATYIVDEHGTYRYANRQAAEQAEMERALMPGKRVEAVLGAHRARALLATNEDVLASGEPQQTVQREETDSALAQVRQRDHIPLASLPLHEEAEDTPSTRGVLVIDQDITGIVRGEERRAATLRQLIATLVEMVDRRDPHAARHSACVAMLAASVGKQMQLDERMVETTRIAGQLMNIGKITVPEALLTTRSALNDSDKDRIRASILASVDLLEGIDFDGPVVETLRQSLTRNPQLVSAQIIAAVNDFVAMISARAWRGGIRIDDAIGEMMKQAGGRYERAVVAALVNHLDNAGGRETLQGFLGANG